MWHVYLALYVCRAEWFRTLLFWKPRNSQVV